MTTDPMSGGDRHIFEEAIGLAVEIGERGVAALTEFMKRDRDSIDRTIRLSRDSIRSSASAITSGSDAQKAARQQALQDAESAVIELVRAVAPQASLAAARIVTGNADLRDQGWHSNSVVALRELARVATSLINESVGFGAGVPADRPRDIVPLDVPADAQSVPIDLIAETWPAPDPDHDVDRLDLVVTPLVGNGKVVAVIPPDPIPLPILEPTTELQLGEALDIGTYQNEVYVICGGRVVGSAALKVTVRPDGPVRRADVR